MLISKLAGKPAPPAQLIDTGLVEKAYFEHPLNTKDNRQLVHFGTSGHRGRSTAGTFTESHVLAVTQAICDYRKIKGYDGPLFLGKDTHCLSSLAERTAIEVLTANGVDTLIQADGGYTPTPVISRAILVCNKGRTVHRADGIVITPSHNPPADGGIKYNPPNGGPADTDVTGWIQKQANQHLRDGNRHVKRVPFERTTATDRLHPWDFVQEYVRDLASVLDLEAVRQSGLKIGVDPLGGASVGYWAEVANHYGLEITVVNDKVDPTFSFMTLDHDGKIRMDCSSPYAMAGLVGLKDRYDIAFGNDPDADRHGIVTRSAGLMNPNHYLCVAIRYLLETRKEWSPESKIGKTLVSSGLIDRVVQSLGRTVCEVPVGFKWFTNGLFDSSVCFGGEESAGASFLRADGSVWTTDKDGLLLGLLAAEITARTGKDPGEHYREIEGRFGQSFYRRVDTPATPELRHKLEKLSAENVKATELAGDPILDRLTHAPGNGFAIGGLKVVTQNGWFAARPSGTEAIYKLYAESFVSERHLDQLIAEAQTLVAAAA